MCVCVCPHVCVWACTCMCIVILKDEGILQDKLINPGSHTNCYAADVIFDNNYHFAILVLHICNIII